MISSIDPGVVSLIENTFLSQINLAFATIAQYASNLLYLFVILELVISGLLWALQRELDMARVFFKVLRIGLIFFIIGNYQWFISIMLASFTKISGVVISNAQVAEYILNPAKIWQYGYDVGINLFRLAATTSLAGLALVQTLLGTGILLLVGLLGIHLIAQIVNFYFIALGALIILPFGAFSPSKKALDRSLEAVVKAGLSLMAVMVIIGIAIITWDKFDFTAMANGVDFNINQPLGLLFTALLFLTLARQIPGALSQLVGDFSNTFSETQLAVASPEARDSSSAPSSVNWLANEVTMATDLARENPGSSTAEATAANVIITSLSSQLSTSNNLEGKNSLARVDNLSTSISEATIKKLKEGLAKE